MKDIYEVLNDIDIDENEFEEIFVDDIEKERVKKNLRKSIGKKRLMNKKKICAAAITFVVMSSAIIAKPALAINIPIIGELFKKNLVSVNKNYVNYIETIGKTKSYKGIDVTFESAAADKNTLFLSFIVKNNNKEIKNDYMNVLLIPTSMKINGENINAAASASWEIIDKNTIKVLKKIDLSSDNIKDKMNVDIDISELLGISGDWGVQFFMDKSKQTERTYEKELNVDININGVKGKVSNVIVTPLTVKIEGEGHFNDMCDDNVPELDFIVLDDKGKGLRWDGGMSGDTSTKGKIKWSTSFISNGNMNSITIIPKYRMPNNDIRKILSPVKLDVNNVKPIELINDKDRSINIKNYFIDGDYLVVKYNQKYFGKDSLTCPFDIPIYVMGKGNKIEEISDYKKIDTIYNKYHNSNDNMSVFKVGKERDLMVGTYDGANVKILKDKAITIKLK
ncbi:hypothetical protein BD780_004198 [Clostridium tetanomorphum]|uniref:DUF4179 domain-containing protein n=1 Tax=Clostridium tetanomorphum TaxID=1553 RepID=A0A923EDL1_CLOTT|nr:DUF4179 domain-containing protein [Clostridium tetanomorphum]KAJ50091.1 hypothetical protein CTM_19649 [Clostridium tetanomorphum DSM 665]MBC2399239.1 DUF4179 domain-containing protein [Clostridium tetanomorphum]MBP1862836.1 hypothetical protein [Clostridium tetanomorphum]NRS86973.1 hypothetical protein [Clostridium tetanomorphum]NRZ99243.1 hypothetical protein [Clostridium tetanomorphum]